MAQQIPVAASARTSHTSHRESTQQVAPDLAYQCLVLVNVVFYGVPNAGDHHSGDRNWVLIDAGLMGTAGRIVKIAAERFGENARPAAIIITHGHCDHVGALEELAARWDAPVYAHELEMPYLNGSAAYPPPDPGVGGGMMSLLSPLYPRGPVNVGERLKVLPPDGSVPGMPGWNWVFTPGHTPGHISLWREADRILLAADAFVTTAQESVYAVATQRPELHGPPTYFTQNWQDAKNSVETLAALEPELVIAGHGPALRGAEMRAALHALARDFERVAVPPKGKYVRAPARAEDGTAYEVVKKS